MNAAEWRRKAGYGEEDEGDADGYGEEVDQEEGEDHGDVGSNKYCCCCC